MELAFSGVDQLHTQYMTARSLARYLSPESCYVISLLLMPYSNFYQEFFFACFDMIGRRKTKSVFWPNKPCKDDHADAVKWSRVRFLNLKNVKEIRLPVQEFCAVLPPSILCACLLTVVCNYSIIWSPPSPLYFWLVWNLEAANILWCHILLFSAGC